MLELYIYVYFIRVFLIWDNIFEFDEVNEIVRIIYILYQRIFNCDNIFEFDEANECVRIIYIYIYMYFIRLFLIRIIYSMRQTSFIKVFLMRIIHSNSMRQTNYICIYVLSSKYF